MAPKNVRCGGKIARGNLPGVPPGAKGFGPPRTGVCELIVCNVPILVGVTETVGLSEPGAVGLTDTR